MKHTRTIYPVGQGGLAVEEIGGFRVMYDCGSYSHQNLINQYIDDLKISGCNQIDCFVLSHYDDDHLNAVTYLLGKMKVVQAVIPLVPADMQLVYDVATRGAYSNIRNVFRQFNCPVTELGDDPNHDVNHTIGHELWEWDIHTMIKPNDWVQIRTELKKNKFNIKKISDLGYVNSQKTTINNIFKSKWNSSNEKGLIMLSQRTKYAIVDGKSMKYGNQKVALNDSKNTGCLYFGDANLRNKRNHKDVSDFIKNNLVDKPLHLVQVPHHGSKYNRGAKFFGDFISEFYFICDINNVRVSNKSKISKKAVINLSDPKFLMVTYTANTEIEDITDVH